MSFTFRLDVSIHLNYLCLFQVVRGNSIILLEALDRIGWSVKVGGVNGQQWRMDFNFIDKDVWERICVWYCVHVWQDAVWGRNMLLYTCRLKSFICHFLFHIKKLMNDRASFSYTCLGIEVYYNDLSVSCPEDKMKNISMEYKECCKNSI